MSRRKPVGLIASGRLIDTALVRIPALARAVGPVAAASLRLASRYANALKAGHAAGLEDMEHCRLIAVQSPAEDLELVTGLMLGSGLEWRGRVVVLLNDEVEVTALEPLRARHAAVCTAAVAPGAGVPLIVVEGDAAAVRAFREWAEGAQVRCVRLNAGMKPVYGAGLTAAGVLITPTLEAAQKNLRAAGLGQADARRILAHLVESAVRSHEAHGRKAWPNPAASGRRSAVKAQLAALKRLDPQLAGYQAGILRSAMGFFGQPQGWLDEE